MNCFQICIFVSGFTTSLARASRRQRLWIAFKFVSLYRVLQPNFAWNFHSKRCELLSNLYLCIGFYNRPPLEQSWWSVVNCFQICIFVSGFTTNLIFSLELFGCELLSNLYLCIGFYNQSYALTSSLTVVNCFQICIFVSGFTTFCFWRGGLRPLWIAFKFVSLYRVLQRPWHYSYIAYVVNCFQICIFVSGFTTKW